MSQKKKAATTTDATTQRGPGRPPVYGDKILTVALELRAKGGTYQQISEVLAVDHATRITPGSVRNALLRFAKRVDAAPSDYSKTVVTHAADLLA